MTLNKNIDYIINQWTHEILEPLVNEVNANVEVVDKVNDNFIVHKTESIDPNDIQEIKDHVVQLKPAKPFIVRQVPIHSIPLLYRVVIDFSHMAQLMRDKSAFEAHMKMMFNTVLDGFIKKKGFGPDRKSIGHCFLRFTVPHEPNKQEYWMKHHDAYSTNSTFEMRAFSDCVLDKEYYDQQFYTKLDNELKD